ncbi:hypothetical protein E5288_WYG019874 [Bos mutus]|uniref:Uncharacterized protein n=1 Tax=Bos mutus TaxID=72004 RepID=A0A6B0RNH2_9CETA|nr:hypothetical protein [Bos mutus]
MQPREHGPQKQICLAVSDSIVFQRASDEEHKKSCENSQYVGLSHKECFQVNREGYEAPTLPTSVFSGPQDESRTWLLL